jgi:hypothetical protein
MQITHTPFINQKLMYVIFNRNGTIYCTASNYETANQIIAEEEKNGNYDMTVQMVEHYIDMENYHCTDIRSS